MGVFFPFSLLWKFEYFVLTCAYICFIC
jgi:hypothetical protein